MPAKYRLGSLDLAIITDGSVSFINRVTWVASGGQFNVHFVRPFASGLNCNSGAYDIRFTNNTSWSGLTLGVRRAEEWEENW